MRRFFRFVTRILFRVLNRMEIRGLENIPEKGGLIIACNHASNADPPVLMSCVAMVRSCSVLAKKELFRFRPLGAFLSFMGSIAVDRNREGGDLRAFRESLRVLKNGGCLLIFPEGTRYKGKKIPPKKGVAFLAHKSGSPVLPAAVSGGERFAKLGKIRVVFGNIMRFSARGKDDRDEYEKFSKKLMSGIYSLKKEKL